MAVGIAAAAAVAGQGNRLLGVAWAGVAVAVVESQWAEAEDRRTTEAFRYTEVAFGSSDQSQLAGHSRHRSRQVAGTTAAVAAVHTAVVVSLVGYCWRRQDRNWNRRTW